MFQTIKMSRSSYININLLDLPVQIERFEILSADIHIKRSLCYTAKQQNEGKMTVN